MCGQNTRCWRLSRKQIIPENVKLTTNDIQSNVHIQSFHNNARWSSPKSQFIEPCDDSSFLALFARDIITATNWNQKVAAGFQHHRTFNWTTLSPRNKYTWLLVTWPLQVHESTGKIVPFETGYFHHTPKRGAHRGIRCHYYQNRLAVVCTELGIKWIFPFGRGHTAGNNRPHSVNFPFTKLHPSVFVPVSIPTVATARSSGGRRSRHQQATAHSRMQATGSKRNKQTPVAAVSNKRKWWIYSCWFNRDIGS